MKTLARYLVISVLAWQVRRLKHKNKIKIIGVGGSIGKTSTKSAIASVLRQKYQVNFQEGNYNDLVSVPLIFFDQTMPSLFNPFAWIRVFLRNELTISKPYPFDIVVAELGTDGPGQMIEFKKYLDLDIGVLTAISEEHMEAFKSLDAIAEEEMDIARLSKLLLVNSDFCDKKFLGEISQKYASYGTVKGADYYLSWIRNDDGYEIKIVKDGSVIVNTKIEVSSKLQLFSICAAAAVGNQLGLSDKQIDSGIRSISPVSGRINKLKGIKDSIIIDDTYNAGPLTVKAAIDTLYELSAPQKIAILGSMNELGKLSAQEHTKIGEYCKPDQIDLLVTIGSDAGKYTAVAARNKGCKVKTFADPYSAGNYIKDKIKPHALILAKGSQNGVFAEEALKSILDNPDDIKKLARQSDYWMKIKKSQFNGAIS